LQPTIITALSGGLGNQMFQYAAGRSLATRRGVPLLLDLRVLAADTLRDYALGGLQVAATIALPADLPSSPGPVMRRLRRLLPWIAPRISVLERAFTFDPSILDLTPPFHLSGNWQSARYFADCADVIRADFQLAGSFTPDRVQLAEAIAARNPVSVHVRRGDYVSNAVANAYHGTCNPDWYAAAKRRADATIHDANYVVFSDDPDWARANLPAFADALFVEPSADGRDEQDLHLMALCRHHIIANSSFSWWGAWLNPRPDKMVIAPLHWFQGATHDTRDLIPAEWIRL